MSEQEERVTPFTKEEVFVWMEYYERGGELDDIEICRLFQTALSGLRTE